MPHQGYGVLDNFPSSSLELLLSGLLLVVVVVVLVELLLSSGVLMLCYDHCG